MTLLITRRQFEGKDREFIIDNGKYKAGILLDDDGKPCHFTFLNREGHPIGDANVIDGKIENPPYSPSGLVTVTSAGHYEIDGVPFFKIADLQDRLFDGTSKSAPSLGMNIELVDNGYRTTDLVFGKDGQFKDIKQGTGYPAIFVATQIGFREPHSVVSLKNGTLSRNAKEISESHMQDILNQFKKEPETFEETLSNGNIETTRNIDGVKTIEVRHPNGNIISSWKKDKDGNISLEEYDPYGAKSKLKRTYERKSDGEKIEHSYNDLHHFKTVKKNGVTSYERRDVKDDTLLFESVFDEKGNKRDTEYYSNGAVKSQLTIKNRKSSERTYYEDGSLRTAKESAWNDDIKRYVTVSLKELDEDGRTVKKIETNEAGEQTETKTYYNTDGSRLEIVQLPYEKRRETHYNSDNTIFKEETVSSDGTKEGFYIDYEGHKISYIEKTDSDGNKTTEYYDETKNLISKSEDRTDGTCIVETPMDSGIHKIITHPDKKQEDILLWDDGKKTEVTTYPDGKRERVAINERGDITSEQTTYPDGSEEEKYNYYMKNETDGYTLIGYSLDKKDKDGYRIHEHYYHNGTLLSKTESHPNGAETQNYYHDDGSKDWERTTDSKGNLTQKGYDENGNLSFTMVHDKEKGTYVQYDANGKLQKLIIKEPSGKTKVRTGLRARLSAIAHKTPRRLEQGGR